MTARTIRVLAITLIVVALLTLSARLFTPFLGPAVWGPMRGIGAMSVGMMRQMRSAASVESELDYLARMIPHHREAVESARTLRERTGRPEMRAFAARIIETQSREIEQMKAWLARWYPERQAAVEYEPMMRDYSALAGDRLDRAFLEDMIPHHMAAVMMSRQLLLRDLSEHEQVAELAARIRDAQLQEIRQMGSWLDAWF